MASERFQSPPPLERRRGRPRRDDASQTAEGLLAAAVAEPVEGEGENAADNQFVVSVARALAILNAFRPGEDPLGNGELAERTRMSKPTVSRLTYTLARCGYLSYDEQRRVYQLGGGALALGAAALSTMNVRKVAYPLMRDLAKFADFNVGLGTRDRDMIIYTDACEGGGLVGLRLFAGSRIPILTTAMGHAYLAGLDRGQRDALLGELRPRYGDEWPVLVTSLRKAILDVKQNGFCISAGEWRKDINGVAAPIRLPGGALYAVNVGGPAYLLSEETLRRELGPRVSELARKVQMALSPDLAAAP